MNAYKLSGHQHVFEVERELGSLAGTGINVTFTAQVVPMCRGIMTTVYAQLARETAEKELLDLYREFYKNDFFVRPLESSASAGTAMVRDTNATNPTRKILASPCALGAHGQQTTATATSNALNTRFMLMFWIIGFGVHFYWCDGFRMPAPSLSSPRASRSAGRRSNVEKVLMPRMLSLSVSHIEAPPVLRLGCWRRQSSDQGASHSVNRNCSLPQRR